jgi:transcriptional regulator with XRE-family HTH domain
MKMRRPQLHFQAIAAVEQIWGPRRCVAGNEFGLPRPIKPVYFVLANPTKASLGQRLRFMRKRLGLTIEGLSRKCRVSHNAIAQLERNETRVQPWVLGRILPILANRFEEAFPESKGDPYDFIIPPTSFGSWLKNLRLRRALKLGDLAAVLKVKPFTVIRYEADLSKPDRAVRERLRSALKLNGELDRFLTDSAPVLGARKGV